MSIKIMKYVQGLQQNFENIVYVAQAIFVPINNGRSPSKSILEMSIILKKDFHYLCGITFYK